MQPFRDAMIETAKNNCARRMPRLHQMMPVIRSCFRSFGVSTGWSLWICAVLAVAGSQVQAQSLYEVTPYSIQVWVAIESDARIAPAWQNTLTDDLEQMAAARVGSSWTLTSAAAPKDLHTQLLTDALPDWAQLVAVDPGLAQRDKLMLVTFRSNWEGYRLRVWEFDLATRAWSPPLTRILPTGRDLAMHTLDLICQQFVPVVRIEQVDDEQVVVAERAGALVRPEESPRFWQVPVSLHSGQTLKAVIRRSDRNGVVGPEGVKPVEWTVMIAEQQDGSQWTCRFESGYRQPFNTRRSSRIEQLGLAIKPRYDHTNLRLVDRREPSEPLVGYEVYARRGGPDESELIGRTDWRGNLTIPRIPDEPVQVLFVRNGQQLLGKLPVVPGSEQELVAPLRNDDLRLEAEGFLIGVQDSLVDLVARREVMAARIRRHLEAGELQQADTLLRELRRLDTQDAFARRVQQRKQSLSSGDSQVQQKIDQLFAQTSGLLGRYLSQEQVDELSRALTAAQRAPANDG
jgi:hypothetical protein